MTAPIDPTAWHDVAMDKLTKVLGDRAGQAMASSVLDELRMPRILSADDLRKFAAALSGKGGFAAAVGGLLGVHAAIHTSVLTRSR